MSGGSKYLTRLCAWMALAPWLYGAVQTVCPASYGSCNYSDVQVALNSIPCGTELQLAPVIWNGNYFYQKNCSGNPIVLTSMRKDFLPLPGERLSPAHYYSTVPGKANSSGNIAVLNTPNTSAPIQIYFPTKGLHMIGIGFTTTSTTAGYTYQLINMEPADLTNIANASDDVVFDRCYVSGPESTSPSGGNATKVEIQTGVYVQGSNVVVENSTIKDIMYRGFESHGIAGSDALGPVTYLNNYISGAGIPIFSGGNQPRFFPSTAPASGIVPNGFTARFNYLFKPYKWWSDPVNNPYYYDYLAFGSYEPCAKNLGENKNGQNVLWEYNVHENQWINATECEGQSFGFTFTPRAESGSWTIHTPAGGQGATTSGTTLSWTGSPTDGNGNPPDSKFACIYNGTFYTCRWIQSVNLAQKTMVVYADPVTGTGFPTVTNGVWIFGWDASEGVVNATLRHNVFRNVNKLFNFQAIEINPDSSVGTANYGTAQAVSVQNMEISNNLWVNTRLMCRGACANGSGGSMWGLNIFNSENPYEPATRTLPSGLTWTHNTFYAADALGQNAYWYSMQFGSWSGANATPLDHWTFTNNVLPRSANGYVRNDSFANQQIANTLATFQTANAVLKNNSLPGAITSTACSGGRVCSGNITNLSGMDAQFANAPAGILKAAPGGAFARAGADGLDLGADFDHLALINGLSVAAAPWSVQLDWDLTSANNDVPCVIEVSPSRNLMSGLGSYGVVDALNPVYFRQPDTDRRTNPKLIRPIVDGTHRTVVIGQTGSVADDNDGTVRDLALTPGTHYWGRIMCGGDTQTFSFTTLARRDRVRWASEAKVSLKLRAPAGSTGAAIAHGPTQDLGFLLTVTPDSAGDVEFAVPVTPGDTTFYQVSFATPNGTVTLPVSSF